MGFDWRKMNKVTKAKNQGACLSCSIFASTGMLESMIAIQKNISVEDIDISEQEFEECGSAESRNTCVGVDNASPINRVINCGGQKPTGAKLFKSDGPDVKCNKTIGGHAAVVIGWGSDKEGEYWLVKGSWGEGWPPHPEKGEGKGVGKMSKYLGLACGIASTGVTADIA